MTLLEKRMCNLTQGEILILAEDMIIGEECPHNTINVKYECRNSDFFSCRDCWERELEDGE
jgi:hypothetical protein